MAIPMSPHKDDHPQSAEPIRGTRYFRPHVDLYERGHDLVLEADMPGVSRESIDVEFENGTLTIHGRVPPRQPDETQYLLEEYELGDFYRTFQVSEHIDAAQISASYADGVLTLVLPKAEAVRPRKIEVRGG